MLMTLFLIIMYKDCSMLICVLVLGNLSVHLFLLFNNGFNVSVVRSHSDVPTADICEGEMRNTTMCPVCDPCDFWTLSDT